MLASNNTPVSRHGHPGTQTPAGLEGVIWATDFETKFAGILRRMETSQTQFTVDLSMASLSKADTLDRWTCNGATGLLELVPFFVIHPFIFHFHYLDIFAGYLFEKIRCSSSIDAGTIHKRDAGTDFEAIRMDFHCDEDR
jgi:hypothetical protein